MKRIRKKRDFKFPEPDFLPAAEKNGRDIWKNEYIRHVFYLSLLGANDVQIAQTFGVSVPCIAKWKRKKPEFYSSMQKGKMMADAKVSHSLYLAAIGYSHPDQVVLSDKRKEFGPDGKILREWTEPLVVDVIKNYPPNVTAAIKWLQARQPDQWGKKLEIKGRVDHHHKLDLSQFSEQELEVIKKLGLQSHSANIEDIDFEEHE